MITIIEVQQFLDVHNYDLRISHSARWIDQKCTPDVLWSISDFVIDYVDNVAEAFTVKNIWQSDYAKETISTTFSKPETDDETARSEYDKVFAQPLNLLCYAGVLEDIGTGVRHLFKILDRDILEFIASTDLNAQKFLQMYIEKVLRDSELYRLFDDFFTYQDKEHFKQLKEGMVDFYLHNTPVQTKVEVGRIFTKILNPLAAKNRKKGTKKGNLSKNIIRRSDLMYNQDNFRDVYADKPKEVSRQDWLAQHPEIEQRTGYFVQQMNGAKRILQEHNDSYRQGVSEWTQFDTTQTDREQATDKHHIFPKNEFPEIMGYLENLILLTANQHYLYAHPNRNTQYVDEAVQKLLLIAKTASIKHNLESTTEPHIYDFENLLYILNVGWNDATVLDISLNDYAEVVHSINVHYA